MEHTPPKEGMPESQRRIKKGETLSSYEPSFVGFTRDASGKVIRHGIVKESERVQMKNCFDEFSPLCNTQAKLEEQILKLAHPTVEEKMPETNP